MEGLVKLVDRAEIEANDWSLTPGNSSVRKTMQAAITLTQGARSTLSTKTYPEVSANAALVLPAVACALLDRQVDRLAKDFENEGGFTERLYRVRTANRRRQGQ